MCKPKFRCFYEEKDTIGKRYRRMDAIGTPFCVTVDHQTKEDQTVTIRYRDSMAQDRIPIHEIPGPGRQADRRLEKCTKNKNTYLLFDRGFVSFYCYI